MYKKLNFKTLVIVVIALAAIIALTTIYDSIKGERSFKEQIVDIDSAAIDHIFIVPSKTTSNIELSRSQGWQVKINDKFFPADEKEIARMLQQLIALKPERLAGSSEESWKKYEVTDSLASRVILKKGDKTQADVLIGKFSYQQATRKMTTYVRIFGEKQVFAVEGFLAMTFNRGSDSFRSTVLINGTPDQWTKLSFNYRSGKSFVLSKDNNKWLLNDMPADSAKVAQYLNGMRYSKGTSFIDSIDAAVMMNPECKLTVEGNNISPFELSYYNISGVNVINSSANPQSFFNAETLKDKLFITEDKLR